MRAADKFILRNATQLQSLDNAAQYLTMFLPGQSHNVELGSEAGMALLILISTYRDELVTRINRERGNPLPLQTRFLEAQTREYRLIGRLIQVIRATELLMEMSGSCYGGERGRKRAVVAVESTKAILRLILLGISKRSLPHPTHVETDLSAEEIEKLVSESDDSDEKCDAQIDGSWIMPRTHKIMPSPSESATELLGSKVLDPDAVRPDGDLLRPMGKYATAAEVLSILRPLIYLALLYRMQKSSKYKSRRWIPWVIGISIEIIARKVNADAYAKMPGRTTGLEREQLQAKSSSLWWWAFRGTFYEEVTRPTLQGVIDRVRWVPVLPTLAEDYLYLFDAYYFSSASY